MNDSLFLLTIERRTGVLLFSRLPRGGGKGASPVPIAVQKDTKMGWLMSLVAGIKSLFQKSRVERELDEELYEYVEASIADKRRSGMAPSAARRAAMAEMGSSNSVKHQIWSSRWESSLDIFFQDIRLGLRSLWKRPGFTAVAVVSLSLGIGANTAIFTLIDQVILRRLPVQDPQQLVAFGDSVSAGI